MAEATPPRSLYSRFVHPLITDLRAAIISLVVTPRPAGMPVARRWKSPPHFSQTPRRVRA